MKYFNWSFAIPKVENNRPLADTTALELRLDSLERDFKSMRLEWENVYDKVIKAVGRINARERRKTRAEEEPPEVQEPTPAQQFVHGDHATLAAARSRRG